MQRTMNAEIRKADFGEWKVAFHDEAAWEVVCSVIGDDRTVGCHGVVVVSTDEAKVIRLALAENGLACLCDASLTYGK
jgi:hypothetical protein